MDAHDAGVDRGPGDVGYSVAADARDVLGELPHWRLGPERWQIVLTVLELMRLAILAGDDNALRQATLDLELASPSRMTPIGAPSGVPAPPPVRLRANWLIHALAGAPPLAADQLGNEPVGQELVCQELVIHVFAPVDGPHADEAYRQLRDLWSSCRRVLGTTEPIAGVGLPADLPEVPEPVTAPAVAAQQTPDVTVQVILRLEHDILVLSAALMRPLGGPPATGPASQPSTPGWVELDERWNTVAASGMDAMLGIARLYLAKVVPGGSGQVAASVPLARQLAAVLAPASDPQWMRRGLTVAGGFAVWETTVGLDERTDQRAERRIAIVAPSGRDPELSAWAWSRGDLSITPLTRYLMHAAKIRYELRVRNRAESMLRLRRSLDDSAVELLPFVAAWPAPAGVRDRFDQLRADHHRVVLMITGLRDMRLTVEIAQSNMAAVLGRDVDAARSGENLIADDMALADWFLRRLDDDLAFLQAARERAESLAAARPHAAKLVPAPDATHPGAGPAPTFGIVTALREELVAIQAMVNDVTRWPVEPAAAAYLVGTMPSLLGDTPHQVVLTLLAEAGNTIAAASCAHLIRSFESVRQIVMVGIAAGVPDAEHPRRHVRLGDVVVATWGIVDYDHVTDAVDGTSLRHAFPPPSPLLAQRAKLLDAMEMSGHRPWEEHLARALTTLPGFARPPADTDRLFIGESPGTERPHPDPVASGHREGLPKVHYGRIGSADRSLRNAVSRDALAARYEIRAFEMEGRGIGDAAFASDRGWFVVRGISDYGDSRTGQAWRPYASLAAAAYVRALLAQCAPVEPR